MDVESQRAVWWHKQAAKTARKFNVAWWMECMTPWLGGFGVVGFATIFALRWTQHQVTWHTALPWVGGGLVACGLGAWWRARSKFVTVDHGLVRLESQLKLNNALTAAKAGQASWPAPLARGPGLSTNEVTAADDGWRWRWQWVGGPFVASLGCLALGLFIPISHTAARGGEVTEPLAWGQMEEWLDKLEQEQVITPEQQKELEEKIEDFRDTPSQEWYEQHSLEASDSMRDQLEKNINDLGRNLETAEQALNALQNFDKELSAQTKDQLAQDFQAALEGLKNNDLKLDPQLLKELSKIDPKSLSSLSKEQLDKMRESAKKKSGA